MKQITFIKFVIRCSSKNEFYQLGDGLKYSNNMEFSTHDTLRDDTQLRNSAARNGGGFWLNDWKDWQNINGYYNGSGHSKWHTIRWDYRFYLKKTQLMIRPAADN